MGGKEERDDETEAQRAVVQLPARRLSGLTIPPPTRRRRQIYGRWRGKNERRKIGGRVESKIPEGEEVEQPNPNPCEK